METGGDQSRDRAGLGRQVIGVEQLLRWFNANVVSHVEDMRDDTDVESAWLEASVEKAEWRRMRLGPSRDAKQRQNGQSHTPGFHSGQW